MKGSLEVLNKVERGKNLKGNETKKKQQGRTNRATDVFPT